jgi:hypothetical protein
VLIIPDVFTVSRMHSQIDQDLACAWLWSIKLLDLGRYRTRIVIDKSLICLGDIDSTHLDRLLEVIVLGLRDNEN